MSLSSIPWPPEASLGSILKAGSHICGDEVKEKTSTTNASAFQDLLRTRLEKFDNELGVSRRLSEDLQGLELETAFASLYVLERVNAALVNEQPGSPPLIGARDMSQLRTHLAVANNWGTDLLLGRIMPALPKRRSVRLPPGAQIVDLTAAYEDYTMLLSVLRRLLTLPFPDGPEGRVSTTFAAATVLGRGFSTLLHACIVIGWLPENLRGDLPLAPELKGYFFALLRSVPPSQCIASLGQLLSRPETIYVSKACSVALSGQLMRQDANGVAGLLSATFGEDATAAEAPLQKLEAMSRLLNAVPGRCSPEEYFSLVIPRLLRLLTLDMSDHTPPAHKRAAAFSLARMAIAPSERGDAGPSIRVQVLTHCLLDPFKSQPSQNDARSEPIVPTSTDTHSIHSLVAREGLVLTPTAAIQTLSAILTNADPLPELLSVLLGPIAPQLYALGEHLRARAAADPALRETAAGLLATWARAARTEEVVDRLWGIVDGSATALEWGVDDEGDLRVYKRGNQLPTLSLAELADLEEGKVDGEESEDANPLGLRPYPLEFAKFLKSLNREDISSALYSRILDAHSEADNNDNPMRKLLLLKLIMSISSQIGDSMEGETALKPDVTQMLTFIKMSLDYDRAAVDGKLDGLALNKLRIVQDDEKDDEGDSDDEDLAPGLEGVDKSEHMSVTAVNLLLALLEKHPDLSPKTVPLLNDIYSQLEPLANSSSDALRPRAREARLTLTARLASTIPSKKGMKTQTSGEENAQEKYQRALKLLQDQLLPVRAHGLLLLRELVSPGKEPATKTKKRKAGKDDGESSPGPSLVQGAQVASPAIEPALVPAILSIFMQSVQDEDSYIFLNAVQGLAAMVDGFGKDVLRGLVGEYAKGLEASAAMNSDMTTNEVDKRVRVGEALGQIIRRCGDALGSYVDIIVPPLVALVRAPHVPTALRTSAVSLLATAADTNAVALSAYAEELAAGMVDLLQVESVRAPPAITSAKRAAASSDGSSEMREKAMPEKAIGGAVRERPSIESQHSDSSLGNALSAANTQAGPPLANKNGGVPGANRERDTLDAQPTSSNTKLPPLRRGALHFLTLLVRALAERAYEGSPPDSGIMQTLTGRGAAVLGYVAATDADGVVKVMAREAAELVEQLRSAAFGI